MSMFVGTMLKNNNSRICFIYWQREIIVINRSKSIVSLLEKMHHTRNLCLYACICRGEITIVSYCTVVNNGHTNLHNVKNKPTLRRGHVTLFFYHSTIISDLLWSKDDSHTATDCSCINGWVRLLSKFMFYLQRPSSASNLMFSVIESSVFFLSIL